jgi:hypothetical protein
LPLASSSTLRAGSLTPTSGSACPGVPAICAVKNGMFRPSQCCPAWLAPDLVIWECDLLAYRGGFLQRGSARRVSWEVRPTSMSCRTAGSTGSRELLLANKLSEAVDHWYDSGLDDLVTGLHRAFGASNVELRSPIGVRLSRQLPRASVCRWGTTRVRVPAAAIAGGNGGQVRGYAKIGYCRRRVDDDRSDEPSRRMRR